ncbi:RICIN domain-containing protein [Yinghuangia seranimata]|uniref:RICIN domain-containing protein n=1 Tax=Yinghuangia seranimata TaxID=408067 RepID=UPI00248D252E|nr:RICIN domain-containing protein [Yinghuangia seranimata]MDI2126301.1 RICIN domain-containing protein [Yinghuangia seranimata]
MNIRKALCSAATALGLAAGLLAGTGGSASATTDDYLWWTMVTPILHFPWSNERDPNLCMGVQGGSRDNGAAVILWECNGNDDQKWTYTTNSAGMTQLVNWKSGKCLDIFNWDFRAGAQLDQWDCHGGANQEWVRDGFTFRNPASHMVLDDPNSSTAWGTRPIIWPYHEGYNQIWRATTSL